VADDAGAENGAYQSLYRRFRPQRFSDVLGQVHVSLALRNAVRDGRVGHAYLFSGPRGTGKTSTARILAKALNCVAIEDGEPCGRCESCVEIARGSSLDVHELDAASNNGVDAMRDLVAHAALGTPGRWKVYIVDEVHMLSTAASNALLKTLEEPPGHVVFVLATTDAQKVLPTIRSRTQHFEFRLLGAETLAGLLQGVRAASGLDVGDDAVEAAVRRGRGSARDALSALDQLAAGGVVDDDVHVLAELAEALAERDPSRALVAVASASEAGRDPQRLAADLADYLRQGFLAAVAGELVSMSGSDRIRVEDIGRRMGLPALVRALEELGRAQVEMRDMPDTRVHLEVTLIRLTHPQVDQAVTALVERIERLERAVAEGAVGARLEAGAPRTVSPPAPPTGSPPPARADDPGGAGSNVSPAPDEGGRATDGGGDRVEGSAASAATGGPELARRTLGAVKRQSARRGSASPTRPPTAATGIPASGGGAQATAAVVGTLPSRDELVQVWGDGLLAALPSRARARFRVGRFLAVDDGGAVFALPNETHRSYCAEVRVEVERALGAHFGTAVPVRLVVDDEADDDTPARPRSASDDADVLSAPGVPGGRATASPPSRPPAPDASTSAPATSFDDGPDLLDPAVLAAETDLAGAPLSPEERLKQAFPGAQEV
jgi:DNA polymerase-3 subunit gamma/tau